MYAFKHEGKVYGPDGPIRDMDGHELQPTDVDSYNKGLEAVELEGWKLQPDVMLAYYDFPAEKTVTVAQSEGGQYRRKFYPRLSSGGVLDYAAVTTWMGSTIGRITSAHVYQHNFGSRMVSITVTGTNGATYYGRASYDWGSCIKLHKHKSRKR